MLTSSTSAPAPFSNEDASSGPMARSLGADLHDPALSAQPGRWQRHTGARRQREPPAGREAQGELGDRVQALLVRYRLRMIEHHSDRPLHRGDGGHEPGDDGDAGARGGQRPEYRRVDRLDPVQRHRQGA